MNEEKQSMTILKAKHLVRVDLSIVSTYDLGLKDESLSLNFKILKLDNSII